jgi:hypothetical protein
VMGRGVAAFELLSCKHRYLIRDKAPELSGGAEKLDHTSLDPARLIVDSIVNFPPSG